MSFAFVLLVIAFALFVPKKRIRPKLILYKGGKYNDKTIV